MPEGKLKPGYVRLKNELQEAIGRTSFSSVQHKVFQCIIRYTYGWQRIKAEISTKQFLNYTGIRHKSQIYRAVRELEARKMVYRNDHQYSINKKYHEWLEMSELVDHAVLRTGRYTKKVPHGTPNGRQRGTPLPIKDKRQLKERDFPSGRVQASDKKSPPCTRCEFQYAVGYDGMDKHNVCLDCRQEEDKP